MGKIQGTRHRGHEVRKEACSRNGSVRKRLELPQCARRLAVKLHSEGQAARGTEPRRAGQGGSEAASGNF